MFKKFTSKLFGEDKQITIKDLLIVACQGYNHTQTGLAAKVAHYLVTGEGADCLNILNQLPNSRHSQLPGHYSVNNNGEYDRRSLVAMQHVLKSATGHQNDFLHRLGLVTEAIAKHHYLNHMESKLTGWFAFLLFYFNQHTDFEYDTKATQFPSRDELLTLLETYDQPLWYIDAYILERSYAQRGLIYPDHLLANSDWITICSTPEKCQQLQKIDASGRNTLCQFLLKQPVIPTSLLPFLAQLSADKSSQVRLSANSVIRKIDDAQCLEFFSEHYEKANASTRTHWISCVAECSNALTLLETWQAAEKTASVHTKLTLAIEQYQLKQQSDNFDWQLPAYTNVNFHGEFPAHWVEDCMHSLEKLIARSERYIKNSKPEAPGSYWAKAIEREKEELAVYKTITKDDVVQALNALEQGQKLGNDIFYDIIDEAKLLKQPNIAIAHFFQLQKIGRWHINNLLNAANTSKLLQENLSDARQLLPLLQEFNFSVCDLTNILVSSHGEELGTRPLALESIDVWPLFAEYPETIDYALDGLYTKLIQQGDDTKPTIIDRLDSKDNYDNYMVINQTLALLADFPKLPPHWLQRIYQLAFDSRKSVRFTAQATAQKHGIVVERVSKELLSSGNDTRSIAAKWLQTLALSDAQPALQQAIRKEKDTAIRAQMLDALQQCGGDISEFTSPTALAEEAAAGLQKAVPKNMLWLQRDRLPSCKFVNGEAVDTDIIYWWCVLAVKLKQPEGSNLLHLYLSLLDDNSQAQLAHCLLSAFITQDTLCPTEQQAHEYAQAHKQQEFDMYQRWAQSEWGKQYKTHTLEDAYNACYKQKKSELLGSAIKEKGLLALIIGGKPNELLALLQPYMKQYYVRRAQIEAILSAIANINDPIIIQFMLSLSRRYRTKSIQELARQLVDKIAQRNGWTTDELGDRTIQTAGFENTQGPTPFNLGQRTLQLQLSDDLKFQLLNEEGKVLKSLPQARKDDDDAAISETKKWFSSCKKELKQVITQQTSRLYESMVTERHWPASDWQEYLHQHPIMFRLLQRTLWQVQLDDDWHSFRPTEDGALIDTEDDEIELPAQATIRLLSGNQLNSEASQAWQVHLKDYKIKPLFEQLKSLEVNITAEQLALDHHKGLMTDTFTLRSLLTKKDYKQGDPEDAGFFDHYYKLFDQLGLRVQFDFSGNCVPEENVSAAIYSITVWQFNPKARGWNRYDALPLTQVPANLLNAIALDYEEVAKKCHADPLWQQKLPFN